MSLADLIPDFLSKEGKSESGDNGEGANRVQADEPEPSVIYECRECGMTVSADTDQCPSCESDAIAEYPVE